MIPQFFHRVKVLTIFCFLMATPGMAEQQNTSTLQQNKRPNILVIIGDDIGWFNIGAYHRGIMSGKTL